MTASGEITPRDLRFHIDENGERDWFGGDPIKSAYSDGFAVMLPEGERFFIRALKARLGSIEDPDIRAGIQGLCIQEAYHAREHDAYNQALRTLGYDVEAAEREARDLL